MTINLEQLKEIAKAGYAKSSMTRTIDKANYMDVTDSEYTLLNKDGIQIFSVFVCNNHVSFAETFFFNHLAAIRKMEELGLIEK